MSALNSGSSLIFPDALYRGVLVKSVLGFYSCSLPIDFSDLLIAISNAVIHVRAWALSGSPVIAVIVL